MAKKDFTTPLSLNGQYPNIDDRYTNNGDPYVSKNAAETALASKLNAYHIGLTVLVADENDPDYPKAKEYWVQPKGTTPETYGLVVKGAGTTDYNDLDNKPTIGDGTNANLPIVGNVKVSASTASGDTAVVTVTPGQNTGEIEMQFTLPKGDKGEDGADGQNGADGAPGDPGEQGKSAYQVWLEEGNEGTEADFFNSLKAHVSAFVPVAYDATAAGISVGQTYNFVLSNPIDGSMVIMPNAGTDATGSIMFAVSVNNGVATYTRVGDVDIDTSNFITKDKITRTLANIGSDNVLSARLGAQILKDMILHADNEDFMQLLDAADTISGYISPSTIKFTDNASATYKIIPIDNAAMVTVKANSTANCNIFLLKEWTGHNNGADAPLVDFQNYAIVVNTDQEVTIPIVSDAKFMYIRTANTSGEDTTPASIRFTGTAQTETTETTLSLSPQNTFYVRAFDNSGSTLKKNTWHNSTNYARAVVSAENITGSILRVQANQDNVSYVAVLAETEIPENGNTKRALFAQCYGARNNTGGSGYGGTVTIPAGQTVELYIPDDTAEVMFYYGDKDTTTYAPQSVVHVVRNTKSIAEIDTSIPENPSDKRVPSTKLLATQIQGLAEQIPSEDEFLSLKEIPIPSDTTDTKYASFIGFNDESNTALAKKWYQSSNFKSWLMPVAPSEEYLVTASSDGRAGIAFLTSDTKPVSGGVKPAWATGYNQIIEVSPGESQLFTAPNNAVVMYVYMGGTSNTRGVAPQKIVQRLKLPAAIDALNTRIDNIAEEIGQGSDILDLYPDTQMLPKFKQLRNDEYSGTTNPIDNCFTFAHISDCHGGDSTSGSSYNIRAHSNWLRFIKFAKHWYENGYLDDIVDTGDIVAANQNNLIEWRYDDDDFTKKVKICIGNHDAANNSDGSEATENNLLINLPAYTKFIAPNAPTWINEGVIFPEDASTQGKCYYYKDYTKSSGNRSVTLRAVFLDFMGWGKNTNTGETPALADAQKTWLENVLADARESNYKVCIFMHFAPLGVKKIDCSFSSASANSLNPQSKYNSHVSEVASVVYQFQEQGGEFVGYFVGHVHRTFVGQLTGEVTDINNSSINLDDAPYQQLVFATDNGWMNLSTAGYSARDGFRSFNTPSHDSFWVIAINTSGEVKILKVGFNLNKYMQYRDTIMIATKSYGVFDETKTNYAKGSVVVKDGILWKIINPVVKEAVGNEGDENYAPAYTDWAASDKEPYSRIISE